MNSIIEEQEFEDSIRDYKSLNMGTPTVKKNNLNFNFRPLKRLKSAKNLRKSESLFIGQLSPSKIKKKSSDHSDYELYSSNDNFKIEDMKIISKMIEYFKSSNINKEDEINEKKVF